MDGNMEKPMHPRAWRESENLTMAAAGKLAGYLGRNPAREWQTWERGEREPRATAILNVEKASKGQVTTASWCAARAEYLAKTGEPPSKRLAAQQTKRQQAA